jgi:hypothetical protein
MRVVELQRAVLHVCTAASRSGRHSDHGRNREYLRSNSMCVCIKSVASLQVKIDRLLKYLDIARLKRSSLQLAVRRQSGIECLVSRGGVNKSMGGWIRNMSLL